MFLIINSFIAVLPLFVYVLIIRKMSIIKTLGILYIGGNAFFLCMYTLYYVLVSATTLDPSNSLILISQRLSLKYIVVSCFLGICGILLYSILIHNNIISIKKRKCGSIYISFFCTLLIINLTLHYSSVFGINAIAALHFHIIQPINEINFVMVKQFVILPFISTVLMFVVFFILSSIRLNISFFMITISKSIKKICSITISIIMPIIALVFAAFQIGLPQYLRTLDLPPSSFYENNYIDPVNIKISFPEKKRNLIVIFVESLEIGFLPYELGGGFSENLVPEIKYLIENNISFSNSENFGGSNQVNGTGWTMAGILSQLNGVPIAPSFGGHSLGYYFADTFMPGAYGVGDILNSNGYKQYLICGADANFSDKDKYYLTHKDSIIYDYKYFQENKFISKFYKVWWGIEDRKLYSFAKELISKNIENDEPFFLTIETADTHPIDGYLDKNAERNYDSQFKNVLHDMSKQLNDFISWLKQQAFYKNTTIVVLGDHLYMDDTVFDTVPSERHPINIFINSLLDDTYSKNRQFTSFDIFPLVIGSIGGEYSEKGLGLGRSINTSERSLLEEFGDIQLLNNELSLKSILYNELVGIN
ncbi:sulfatase domain protein [Treponema primitia ZAS-2]|uniref:Sulfatase domain protein n=1 Tax=Treponema primitia (strain ATCC BAA-887 / DSM 12427 / ZAS-2) TaxID=545694 RepID=F5YMD3_TREPZ|nr:LTA synthase family protein [Treponema primitia]AEF86621.1 sulfatase domain protein [Treponema primitia ZAS-2]